MLIYELAHVITLLLANAFSHALTDGLTKCTVSRTCQSTYPCSTHSLTGQEPGRACYLFQRIVDLIVLGSSGLEQTHIRF